MSAATTAADVGHVLVVLGSSWTVAWLVGDAARGWTATRRVGRRVLRALDGRPRLRVTVDVDDVDDVAATARRELRVRGDALARRGRVDRRRACARRGHLPVWDGYRESCRRCDAVPPPGSVLLDDPVPPDRTYL